MNIEFDSVEAHLTLEAVQRAALDELIASAGKGGEDAEIRSKVLQRVASRIADEFIPSDEDRRAEIELGLA